ncbi:DNA-formamidopyrimidine glycosylase family protein [Thermomonas sp.]
MPEGPSIVILRDAASIFARKTVRAVSGNSKTDIGRMRGRRVIAVRSWGKHFLLQFTNFSLRVHLMMFGSYRINDDKPATPRLRLEFDNGYINFYACSVRFIEGDLDEIYDWSGDVMSDDWNPVSCRRKLRAQPETLICDALLDQNIFAGVGNIIKNEILFRTRVHPCNQIGTIPTSKRAELVRQARIYSFEFLAWKRAYVLRQHWMVHNKRVCPRCGVALTKAYLGKSQRRSFFCENCQLRY